MTDEERHDSFAAQKAAWALEVGAFVTTFGSIEGYTYHALRLIPRDPIAQALIEANFPLKPRLDLLIAIARAREGESWVKFAEVLKDVQKLAAKRNLIAHNGVHMDIYQDASGMWFVEEGITNSKKRFDWKVKLEDRDRVAFNDLVRHRQEAERLEWEISEALRVVMTVIETPDGYDIDWVLPPTGSAP